jgi:hypothetical protein
VSLFFSFSFKVLFRAVSPRALASLSFSLTYFSLTFLSSINQSLNLKQLDTSPPEQQQRPRQQVAATLLPRPERQRGS